MTTATARKLRGNAEDYPYDPSLKLADMPKATLDLDRLRWIPWRGLAQSLYELHEVCVHNERTGKARRFKAEAEREALQKELAFAQAALDGKHGHELAALAQHMLIDDSAYERQMRTDAASLSEFRAAAQRFRAEHA